MKISWWEDALSRIPGWLTWRRPVRQSPSPDRVKAPGVMPTRAMSGDYLLLYKYLEERYANAVVLTFAEIEDLLGFALPEQARLQQNWWLNADLSGKAPSYSDAWTLASRTAVANLPACTVLFERRP